MSEAPIDGTKESPPDLCPRCGTERIREDQTLICPSCMILSGLTPGKAARKGAMDVAMPATWMSAFPQLEIGKRLEHHHERDVYVATEAGSGSPRRLVLLTADHVRAGGGMEAWERQLRALTRLHHPHLAEIVAHGDLGQRIFWIVEAPEGIALEAILSQEGPSAAPARVERLLQQVGDAVASAGAVGVTLRLNLREVIVADGDRAILLPNPSIEAVVVHPRTPTAHAESEAIAPGQLLGPYQIVAKIGEGGFGDVWLADQEEPVKRRVAIKIVKPGMDTRRVLARFESERQTLGQLNHPNIARVLDAGATKAGRPYFVLEAVDGIAITDHCQREKASIQERLRLMMAVCQAVQHAHQKGIIHRDLKPSNVLVSTEGNEARPKVIDFGIAKAVDQRPTEHTLITREHQLLGTPDYMSPEQTSGAGHAADSRSDVYSLGVLLFELLTGSLPKVEGGERNPAAQALDPLRQPTDVPKPSGRLIANRRSQLSAALAIQTDGNLGRELDWIVLKSLETDPDRRYQTPAELGEDLRRFLMNEPVAAGPPTRIYQLQKFVRRHRVSVSSGVGVAMALVLGASLAWVSYLEAEKERRRVVAAQQETERQAAIADAVNAFLSEDLLASANPDNTGERSRVTLAEAVDRAATKVDERFADQPEVLAALHFTLARTYEGLSDYGGFEKHARRRVEILQDLHGANHRETIWARSLLAQALERASKFDEALQLHRDVLADKEKVLGAEHASTLRTRRRIADILGTLGRYGEAELALRDLLDVQERALAPEHVDTLATGSALERTLFDSGFPEKQREAIELARERLASMEACCGSDHANTMTQRHALAVMLSQSGEAVEAERLHRQLLHDRERVFGEAHALTLTSMSNLAVALGQLDRREEAIDLLRRVVQLRKTHFGEGDLGTLASMHNLASALYQHGNVDEALSRFQEVVEVGSEVLGDRHLKILVSKDYVAHCHDSLGDREKAANCYRENLQACKEALGPRHPQTLAALNNLAFCLGKLGRIDEAVPYWEELSESSETAFGPESLELANNLNNYAEALREHGRHGQSVPIFQRVEEIKREALGVDHEDAKWAKAQWLTSKKQAGLGQTPEEAEEVERLFKEVTGRDIGEFWREIKAEEGKP